MKAPSTPSAKKTAASQSAANISTAQANQAMSMVDQTTPYGSITYTPNGDYTFYDAAQGKNVTIPRYQSVETLTPEQQHLLQQEQTFDRKYNDIALAQTDKIGGLLGTPFDYNPGEHEGWANDLYGKLNNDNMARDRAALETQLVNKGLTIGSDAYNNEMSRLYKDQQSARDNFLLNSYATGMNTALTERNQPINETSALINGGQVQQPMFQQTPQFNSAGTDVAGIMMSNAALKNANYQAMMGGLAGIGGAAMGGWAENGFAVSDRRLKTDINKIGEYEDGIGKYSFRYKGSPLQQVGAMAQEVEKKKPEAVGKMANGYKAVNYNKLFEKVA